jgi:dTDP-4-dehydrorhamnose 3,5-epimerase
MYVLGKIMPERFIVKKTPLYGVLIVERKYFEDERGSFGRLFCADEFQKIGLKKPIVQINQSMTKMKGTVRGMHFQLPPHAEIKIVSCLKGAIYDVVVDLRHGSEAFLSWHGETLSAKNKKTLIVPEGFAHGFQALTNNCEIIYFVTEAYNSEAERGINAQDKRIGINWPLEITCMSEKDKKNMLIDNDYGGVLL